MAVYTDIELSQMGIITTTYKAMLNSGRQYPNTISTAHITICADGRSAVIGNMQIQGDPDVIKQLKYIVEQSQYYRDSNGRKRPAHIYYICICADIKLLYANIYNADDVSVYLKSKHEPLYIDVGECLRIVEYSGDPETYHNICKREGVLMYTATGIVRNRLKVNWNKQNTWTHDRIESLYPDEQLYRACMRWLYRGGKVFCAADPNTVYSDVKAADITSAHIYHMLTELYPTTPFQRADPNRAIEAIYHGLNAILDITFYNVTPRLNIGWETKTIDVIEPICDGKGILYADTMRVMITDVDWMTYQKVYNWDHCTVNAAWIAHSNKLPAYLRKTLKDTVRHKQELKHNGVTGDEYITAKRDVNMLYGMTAQKLNLTTCDKNGKGIEQNYNTAISHKILSPFWAVWTAAYTRYQQASMIERIFKNGAYCLYGDTDSIYWIDKNNNGSTALERIISDENMRIQSNNKLNGLSEDIADIGTWTIDRYKLFKALGCKKYMYSDMQGHIYYKCSGILSQAMNNITFDEFAPDTVIHNARRTICRKHNSEAAHYRYEDIKLDKCSSDVELEHWYIRNVLKI